MTSAPETQRERVPVAISGVGILAVVYGVVLVGVAVDVLASWATGEGPIGGLQGNRLAGRGVIYTALALIAGGSLLTIGAVA